MHFTLGGGDGDPDRPGDLETTDRPADTDQDTGYSDILTMAAFSLGEEQKCLRSFG